MRIVSGWWALGVALMALAARAEDRPRVVVLQIEGSTDALKRLGAAVSEQVLTELQRTGRFEAMGTSDLQVLLGVERQQALLGCSAQGESGCMTELSAALGAPWLVAGSLAQAGKATRLDIKLISARDGKAVFRDGASFAEESALFGQVTEIVERMISSLAPRAPSAAPAITALSGGAVTIAGAGLLVASVLTRAGTNTDRRTLTYSEARAQLELANSLQLIGGVAAGVGLATLISGLVWWNSTPAVQPQLAFSVTPSGVVVLGSF